MGRKKKVTLPESKVDLVDYKTFFQQSLLKGLVKPWQEKEIRAFFGDLGLKDKEPVDKYIDALQKY